MSEKKVRAAIYARVSTTDQNPESQLQELRQYVEQRGFVLHKEYVDYVSGSFEKRKKRRKPQDIAYQELMSDARKRLIDCVIVSKYDRFARSLSILVNALEEFNQLGVDFISRSQDIDTTTPMGRFFFNVIGSFADFEREMIVERVRAGLANAKAKGVRLGRPEKDPTAAERIIKLRQEGRSFRQIGKSEGLSAPGVLKILRRHAEPEALRKPEPVAVPTNTRAPDTIPEIWQLKIYLLIVKPQVWRRVLVPSNITFANLSEVIQNLFGWTDLCSHMWVPRNAKGGYELKCDENTFRVCDVDVKPGGGMFYEYGWDWTHEVSFEKIVGFNDKIQYPVCVAGAMVIPPDAEGDGAVAYTEARKKKRSKDFRVKTFFNGLPYFSEPKPDYTNFDHRRFDLDEINQRLGVRSPERKKRTKQLEDKKGLAGASLEVYQLRITIFEVTPLIWRRVLVSSDTTLNKLSDMIRVLFDWSGYHLHKFCFPGPFGFSEGPEMDGHSEDIKLAQLGFEPGDCLVYEYDFGDSWMHEIVLEKVSVLRDKRSYPMCTAGARAGPPEDCGGPEAYMHVRGGLKKPRGKKRRNRLPRTREFYRENYPDFDPDKFDRTEINRQLAVLFRPERISKIEATDEQERKPKLRKHFHERK